MTEHDALADAFVAALEEGSVAKLLGTYAPDVRIWHNHDRQTQTAEENIAGLDVYFTAFPERRYTEIRRRPIPGGFVQQHVVELTRQDGKRLDWPGCIIAEVKDGFIARIEEYIDMAQITGVDG